jgi:Amt family ammonium transporter
MFVSQMTAILVTAAYSFIATVIILKILDRFVGLRIDEESEVNGLDISQHGESGYTL